MEVRMLREKSVDLSPTRTQKYPKNWSGQVDDAIVKDWVEGEDYEPTVVTAGTFTPEQTEILRTAADQMTAMKNATGEGAENDGDEIDLEKLRKDELIAIAENMELATSGKTKAELIAAIAEAAKAAEDAENGDNDGEGDDD